MHLVEACQVKPIPDQKTDAKFFLPAAMVVLLSFYSFFLFPFFATTLP